jgi:exopolyphosphatase / guanosine-5'-triphosphate,3'-diphosphate pyrophosphatase
MEETAALRPSPRTGVRRAAIDVGTNSVKLLIADVVAGQARPIHETSRVTRLGRGFYDTHLLQADAIEQTASAVAEFTRIAHDAAAVSLRVIATSAAREAKNAGDLTAALRAASGQELEIISGEQEAEWAFRGVTSDAVFATGPLLIMDVGGGSTELILGVDGHPRWRQSFPLGVVRLLEALRPADPPATGDLAKCREHVRAFIEQNIAPALVPQLAPGTRLVGVGGTATVLAAMELELRRFDRDGLQGYVLAHERVATRVTQLWSLPHARRGELPGLPPNRADVILSGAVIYEELMARFGFGECRVSTRGLRYAAVLEAR